MESWVFRKSPPTLWGNMCLNCTKSLCNYMTVKTSWKGIIPVFLLKHFHTFLPLPLGCMWAELFQLFPTLYDPMECSPPVSVHGILKARMLEWVAMPSSRWSSWPTHISCEWPNSHLLHWQACSLLLAPLGKPFWFLNVVTNQNHLEQHFLNFLHLWSPQIMKTPNFLPIT